jgi:hypothetical protein
MGDAVGRQREEAQVFADEVEPAATDLDVVIGLAHARDGLLRQLPGQHGDHAGVLGHRARLAGRQWKLDCES